MSDLADAQAFFDRFGAVFAANDRDGLRALWEGEAEPFYLAEEHDELVTTRDALEGYWDLSAAANAATALDWRVRAVKPLAPDVLLALFTLDWTIHVAGTPNPYGGFNRGMSVLVRRDGRLRFAAHCEAPLAPITYLKKVYAVLGRSGPRAATESRAV